MLTHVNKLQSDTNIPRTNLVAFFIAKVIQKIEHGFPWQQPPPAGSSGRSWLITDFFLSFWSSLCSMLIFFVGLFGLIGKPAALSGLYVPTDSI